jgi:hypothetical protein
MEQDKRTEVLRRASRGEATFHELAEVLAGLDGLLLIAPPGDTVRFFKDLDAALGPNRDRRVTVKDAPPPRPHGMDTSEGFVLFVFTDDRLAREYAVTKGIIAPDDVLSFLSKGAATVLFEVLVEQHAGIVIDSGAEHQLNLRRPAIARLYALLALADFAALPALHVVGVDGRPHLQPNPNGGQRAFVFQSKEVAAYGAPRLGQDGTAVPTVEVPTRTLLERLLQLGVTQIVVDPETPLLRSYERDDMLRMLELAGGDARAASSAPDPALQPEPGASDAAARTVVRRLAPLRPPARDTEANHAAFESFRKRVDERSMTIWSYLDGLAFEFELWAMVHPRPVDGFTWPAIFADESDPNKVLAKAFTRERDGRAAEADARLVSLSGLELMRWVWAAPKRIDQILINNFAASEGWVACPGYSVLSVVYPHFQDVKSLAAIDRVPLARLGTLPGARGLKVEVARALAAGWKELIALEDPGGAPPEPIEHDGRRWLPLFSEARAGLDFALKRRSASLQPSRPSAEPPFASWLVASRDVAGMLLDPEGPCPMPLEHTDLLVLDCTARGGGARPDGGAMAAAVGRLLAAGAISPRLAGQIVGDWPQWFVLALPRDDGQAIATLPDEDIYAVFSSEERARAYADGCNARHGGLEGFVPHPVAHRWNFSVFNILRDGASGGCIDPGADLAGGVRVDGEAIAAAIERVGERLQPRVPGFVAGA